MTCKATEVHIKLALGGKKSSNEMMLFDGCVRVCVYSGHPSQCASALHGTPRTSPSFR